MILALDTATQNISLALRNDHELIAESTWRTSSHHTVELASAVDALLRRAEVKPCQLQAIAVALGPGSYTGLRIGLSLAKGLALACTPPLPLIGIPTLDIMAAAQPHLLDRLCVVIQAGRGRVNAGFYVWLSEGWKSTVSPVTLGWTELADRLDLPMQITGEISPAGDEALASLGDRLLIASTAFRLRRAGFLAEMAARKLQAGQVDDPATLAPIYLH